MFKKEIKEKYKLLKEKKVDNLMIQVGLLGVLIGLIFSVPIINQIFAWPILFGVCIKLYDFTEVIERDRIPYDFNKLLPPPPKKKN